jgi:hypothetical protein
MADSDDLKAQLLKRYAGGIGNLPASAFNADALSNAKRLANPNTTLPGPYYESTGSNKPTGNVDMGDSSPYLLGHPGPTGPSTHSNMGEFAPQPKPDPLSLGSPGAVPAARFPKLQNKMAPAPPPLADMFPNDPSAAPENAQQMTPDQLKLLSNIKSGK